MNIGIVGAGHVGGNLGQAWGARGHAILFGVRDPKDSKYRSLLAAAGSKARLGSVKEAAAFGEVVVLATPWGAAEQAIRAMADVQGKILIDCTNPLAPGSAGLSVGHSTSAGEQVAQRARGARVVKAFNTTGANNFLNPKFGSESASMFICGDDASAKAVVLKLAAEIGFEALDAGPPANARLLEPLATLWIYLAYQGDLGRDIAIKLLRR